MKAKRSPVPATRNLVAKHAAKFCKPAAHRNKKTDYQRTPKHRHRDFGVFCGRAAGNQASTGRTCRAKLRASSLEVSHDCPLIPPPFAR